MGAISKNGWLHYIVTTKNQLDHDHLIKLLDS
jgi:hypothetical protein